MYETYDNKNSFGLLFFFSFFSTWLHSEILVFFFFVWLFCFVLVSPKTTVPALGLGYVLVATEDPLLRFFEKT